jgi:hypothetical protein
MSLHNPLAERALTILAVLLVIDVFVIVPLAESVGGNYVWADLAFIAVLVLGALAIWGDTMLANAFVASGIVSIGLRAAKIHAPHLSIGAWDAGFAMLSLALLMGLVARRVFAGGRISTHRVVGAVTLYLLMGLVFAQVFRLIAVTTPNAFMMFGQPADANAIVPHLTYFSFVTLTTLGYGEITPLHPVARSVATLAAILGTLFPAVLIGRLVSLEIVHDRNTRD